MSTRIETFHHICISLFSCSIHSTCGWMTFVCRVALYRFDSVFCAAGWTAPLALASVPKCAWGWRQWTQSLLRRLWEDALWSMAVWSSTSAEGVRTNKLFNTISPLCASVEGHLYYIAFWNSWFWLVNQRSANVIVWLNYIIG